MADFVLDLSNLIKGDGAKMTIDEVTASLEKLNSVYGIMVSQAQGKAEEFAKGLEAISAAADKLEDSFKSLDISSKKDQDTLSKGASELDSMVKSSDEYTIALGKTEKQIDALIAEQEKLREAQEKASKANEHAAGSLDELRLTLANLGKSYNAMGTAEREANGPETLGRIKEVSTQIKAQDGALKAAKRGIDVAKGSYNELAKQVSAAKQQLKDMEGGIGSSSEEFKKLQKFVADGNKQLKEFDESIGDNQRDVGNYKKAVEGLGQLGFGGLISFIKTTGKELLALAGNPFFLVLAGLVGLFKGATYAVKTFWETTGDGEDILDREKLKLEAFFGVFQKKIASTGQSIVEFFGGVEKIVPHASRSLVAALGPLGPLLIKPVEDAIAKMEEAAPALNQFADEIDALGDKITRNIIDRAQTELNSNKLLEQSKNTLLYSDEQRLGFLKRSGKLREEQAQREIALAKEEYAQEVKRIALVTNDPTDEQKKKVTELAAKILQLEADYFGQQKRNTSQVVALTQEIERRKREAAQRELDTRREISKFLLQDIIDTNKKILDDERSTLEERTRALLDNNDTRIAILDQDKQHELDIIKRAAEERILAEGKGVTDALLSNDKAYLLQVELITGKYQKLVTDANEKTKEAVKENFFTVLARDASLATAKIQEAINEQLLVLNNQLNLGEITLKNYEDEKAKIQAAGQRISLSSQLDFLNKELSQVKDGTVGKAELLEKISKVELDLSQITTTNVIADLKKREAQEKQLAANVQQIQNEAFALASVLIEAQAQRAIDALNKQSADLEEAHQKDLELAGDNAEAKKKIEKDFQESQVLISQQIKEQQRKAAVYNKILSSAQIVIDTATAIVKTLAQGGALAIPLAATIGAIGALNLGKVLATPIPAFYTGTDSAPGGLSLVADRFGPELAVDKSGSLVYYDKPQVTWLEKGTKVFDASDTAAIMAALEMDSMSRSFGDSKGNLVFVSDNSDVVEAIRESKGPDIVRVWDDIHYVRKAQSKKEADLHKSYFGY